MEAYPLRSPGFIFLITSFPMWLGLTFLFTSLILVPLSKLLPFSPVRVYKQLTKLAVSMSAHLELILFTTTSLLLYVLMVLLVGDDISEQVYELVNSYFILVFTCLVLTLILLYSVHIFTFLALSAYSRRSFLVVLRQFKNDIMDLLSLILRFYVLLFRLNVYDLLEDLFDGYYIFLGDFGDEYLLDNLLIPLSTIEGFTLDSTEENFDFEDTSSSLSLDLIRLYYTLWGEFAYFYLFCLEEGARLILATYIIFLFVFEIHATNMRFFERHLGGALQD